MKHTVIGTAGHIDHGKTLLLKALTGVDADRLPEEQERGMTIDLGFVFLGEDVTIIDVPGHEKFIKNMLAGVSTIDFVILVVAADDGIMPQTREHFDILKLLDISSGVIAVTKTDIVEKDWLELVIEDIKEFVSGTFLEDAPIMPLSSITGDGIPAFKQLLTDKIENTPAKEDRGIFRLWIDRVFVLKGIGTVIAGTVLSGILKPGDKLTLLPQEKEVRVRKLQVHNEEVEQSTIGERVAANLIGVEASEIERGNVLCTPGHFEPTYMINAKLYLLQSCTKSLVNRTRVRFHIGTRELLARVVTLDKKPLDPGNATMVQFRLEEPVIAEIGDRYIIRSYSPAYTIGGGTVLENHPQKLKYLPEEEMRQIEKLEQADPKQVILHYYANNPLAMNTTAGISREIKLKEDEVKALMEEMTSGGVFTVISEKPATAYSMTEQLDNAEHQISEYLEQFHRQFPFRKGLKRSELKNKLMSGVENPVFDFVLNSLFRKAAVKFEDETVFAADHKISFSPEQQKICDEINSIYLESNYVTPAPDELAEKFPKVKNRELMSIVSGMIERGDLTEIKTDVEKPAIFHSDNVKKAEKLLIEMLKEKGEIKLFEFREAIKSTRKFTTPLLIYFDRKGITERDGDVRRLAER